MIRGFALSVFLGATTWSFEKDEVGKPPAGFEFATTAKSPAGRWVVVKDGDRQVLAQADKDKTERRFAMAVVKDSAYKDLALSVKGKPLSGEKDQAVGLVWRYQDPDNYYLARSNALENNVRLYRVFNGNRIKFAGKEGVKLEKGAWHTLKVEHKGAEIKVYVNGEHLFTAEDRTFPGPGKIGLWVKSDSVTYFDALTAEELKSP